MFKDALNTFLFRVLCVGPMDQRQETHCYSFQLAAKDLL